MFTFITSMAAVIILSVFIGQFVALTIKLTLDEIDRHVIFGKSLDLTVVATFAILALTAEIGIPAVAIILATC